MTALSPGQSPPPVSTPIRTAGHHSRTGRRASFTIAAVTPRALTLAALACAAALAGGFDGADEAAEHRPVRGHVLDVYASRPTEGPSAATARAVMAGQRQALADAGSRVGRYRIRLISMSASRPGSGNWDPGQ